MQCGVQWISNPNNDQECIYCCALWSVCRQNQVLCFIIKEKVDKKKQDWNHSLIHKHAVHLEARRLLWNDSFRIALDEKLHGFHFQMTLDC